MDVGGLAVVVLQDVGERAVQNAGLAGGQAGGVLAEVLVPRPPASTPIEFHRGIVDERGEDAGRIAAAADAGDDIIRQPAVLVARHCSRVFPADDRLEIAHDHRERVRPDDRCR